MSVQQDAEERLQNELSLLEAMYPDQTSFDARAREVKFTTSLSSDNNDDKNHVNGSMLHIRLPTNYPANSEQLPEILSAASNRIDLRGQLKAAIETDCTVGEEVLDTIIAAFNDLCDKELTERSLAPSSNPNDQKPKEEPDQQHEHINDTPEAKDGDEQSRENQSFATVVIWLHHLLATSKRKHALHPPSPAVAGVTKPGYPGVLVFSGPADAVREHVEDLKGLKWQGFQVRYEDGGAQRGNESEKWDFKHGDGVIEFEKMAEVVDDVVSAENREVFLEAMKVK